MKDNQELLSSILKTAQMGQLGIRGILDCKMSPALNQAIRQQLREYDKIETEAHSLASRHHWVVPELNPAVRVMTEQMSRMRLSFGNPDSTIAAMMIRGNTSGVIKGTKNLNHAASPDGEIGHLLGRLIETEDANINQMKPFL